MSFKYFITIEQTVKLVYWQAVLINIIGFGPLFLNSRYFQGSKTQLEQLFKEEPLLEEEEKLAPSEDEEMEEEETGRTFKFH